MFRIAFAATFFIPTMTFAQVQVEPQKSIARATTAGNGTASPPVKASTTIGFGVGEGNDDGGGQNIKTSYNYIDSPPTSVIGTMMAQVNPSGSVDTGVASASGSDDWSAANAAMLDGSVYSQVMSSCNGQCSVVPDKGATSSFISGGKGGDTTSYASPCFTVMCKASLKSSDYLEVSAVSKNGATSYARVYATGPGIAFHSLTAYSGPTDQRTDIAWSYRDTNNKQQFGSMTVLTSEWSDEIEALGVDEHLPGETITPGTTDCPAITSWASVSGNAGGSVNSQSANSSSIGQMTVNTK